VIKKITPVVLLLATLIVPSVPAHAAVTRYEAENATISQGVVESNHAGFTGTGFVNYDNTTGGYVEWTVTAEQAGDIQLSLRYANGTTANRSMDLAVNGVVVAPGRAFNGTGSWDTWQTATLTASLVAGANTIRATATTANGGPNVDSLSTGDTGTPPATDWSREVIRSTMSRYTPSSIGGWSYPIGLYLYGQYVAYKRTGDPGYLAFIKSWADRFVDSSGHLSNSFNNLDSMQATNIMLFLAQEYPTQTKYRTAATQVHNRIYNGYPRTSDGGFWHSTSDSRQGQLWGDGVFMVDPFLARYGQVVGDTTRVDNEVANQLVVYGNHLQRTTGNQAGLLYHAYDEPGGLTASWVHADLGNTNGLTWCRAEGWYGMTLTEILRIIPANHPQRAALISILQKLTAAYIRYQDPASGRWWQVVDHPGESGNWLETSCSAMYTTVISRAIEDGYIPASQANQDAVVKGYHGVLQQMSIHSDGLTYLTNISEGTNVDDVTSYYYNRAKNTNDFHGLGAFLLMNEQMIKTGVPLP
jgi:unsaturated rhamnogalacturonyl hydrolase